jgi:hypothetical protein
MFLNIRYIKPRGAKKIMRLSETENPAWATIVNFP